MDINKITEAIIGAPVTVIYNGVQIGHAFFIDILVEHAVVVEVKAVERLDKSHT